MAGTPGAPASSTQRLVAETGGFLYDADSYADDLPYWIKVAGRDHLIVPYTLDANDMRFATVQGFNSGDQFFAYLRDSFDVLYAEGAEAPKMMSVGLHCRLAGKPGPVRRARAVSRPCAEARQGLDLPSCRYCTPLARPAPTALMRRERAKRHGRHGCRDH